MSPIPKSFYLVPVACLLIPDIVYAAPENLSFTASDPTSDKTFADMLWLMVAAFLVFFMQAGFALVETGFTRAKNVANIMMKNIMDFGIGTIVFWAAGFSLMYGADVAGLFGTGNFFLSEAITNDGSLDSWMYADWFFQAVFAATAATIVSGAMAERTRFSGYLIVTILVTALIYPIVGHWIWGGGWLSDIGFYDFAGSTVVHSVGAWAGLVGTIVLGPRIGRFVNGKVKKIPGHSAALGTLGVFILWLGWFGFNAGSTLGADSSMARIAVMTTLAAAGGATTAMMLTWKTTGKPDLTFTLNGGLAGLVSITAPCAVVAPFSAVVIGGVGGVIMFYGSRLLEKYRVDDPVGAIPVHGFAGVWGTLSVALFAQPPYTTEFTGLFFGGSPYQLWIQAVGILAVAAWTIGVAWVVLKAVKVRYGLRVSELEEMHGLDLNEHGTNAYPDFFDENDARSMLDLEPEQELELLKKSRLKIDID